MDEDDPRLHTTEPHVTFWKQRVGKRERGVGFSTHPPPVVSLIGSAGYAGDTSVAEPTS